MLTSLLMVLLLSLNPAKQTQIVPGTGPIQHVTVGPMDTGYMARVVTEDAPSMFTVTWGDVVPTRAEAVNNVVPKMWNLGHRWRELDMAMETVWDVELQVYTRWERHGTTYQEVP